MIDLTATEVAIARLAVLLNLQWGDNAGLNLVETDGCWKLFILGDCVLTAQTKASMLALIELLELVGNLALDRQDIFNELRRRDTNAKIKEVLQRGVVV